MNGAPREKALRPQSLGLSEDRTKDEMRAITFRKVTYGKLALIALVGGVSYGRTADYIAEGYLDRRWIFLPPLLVLAATVQVFRKWRFERLYPDLHCAGQKSAVPFQACDR